MTVLNINAGNNRELKENCRTLREYMQYVECVRHNTDGLGMQLNEAVESAVNECINKGILKDFLLENKAEAMTMSIFEYNEAEEKEKMRRAEYAGGYEDGIERGIEQGIERLNQLIIKLNEQNRQGDIVRAAKDADFRNKLFEEFGLNN